MARPSKQGKVHEEHYKTWANGDERAQAVAFNAAAEALKKVEPLVRSAGSNIYLNIGPGNTSVRDSFTRRDYEDFRPHEAAPTRPKDVMCACMNAAESVGIVHNVIDLMADFSSQGLDITHPNERIEKFCKEWFRRVGAFERSERLASIVLRAGTVIVKRHTAKLKMKDERRLKRAAASPDLDVEPEPKLEYREIPWRYTFLNPLSVEVLGEQLVPFVGPDSFAFAVKVPDNVARVVKQPKTDAERAVVAQLPEDIRRLIARGEKLIPLDPAKLRVHYYKRDDWQAWATPLLAPILKDLKMLEKMKLADLAALDGVISCIRVWKLGSLEHKIMPTSTVIQRLAEMLLQNVGGGVMDLIWGPDIELVQTATDAYKFLGETKYAPVLNAIFQGLGIPPTLSGNANPGGFTNNYISLKTLVQRLEYVRGIIRAFWEHEARLLQQAMRWRFPPQITFDKLLTDEAAEKQLLIHLWDRGLLSDEYLQDSVGAVSDIERVRIRRDMKRRKEGKLPRKASPYHNPMYDEEISKIFAQTGAYAPSEFGVELEPKKEGEVVPVELDAKLNPKPVADKPKGTPGQGRPKNKKDSQKRKQKTVKPRTSAQFVASLGWAEDAQARIAKLTAPVYLQAVAKKTLRELTDEESQKFESFKFCVLCQLPLYEDFDEQVLARVLSKPLQVPVAVNQLLRATLTAYVEEYGREPPIEALRRFQASVYALYRGEYGEEEEGGSATDGVS